MDDRAYQIARQFPVTVLKNPSRGVSAARNFGAKSAAGDILLFMDTDVILPPDALEQIVREIDSNRKDGAVGVQSKDLRYRNFCSRYKNHWMRYTYRRLSKDVHLFYTSCAAIRRDLFLETGGFDENYRRPDIEDTVFGAHLGQKQARISVLKDLEIEHAKGYTLVGVLKTDFKRSVSLVRYILRNWKRRSAGGIRRTSVPKRFMLGTMMMVLFWIGIAVSPVYLLAGILGALAALILMWFLNASWLWYLFQEESAAFAVRSAVFLPFDVTSVLLGMTWGFVGFISGNEY